MALQSTIKTGGPRRPVPLLASLLLSALFAVASIGTLAAQGSGISLVNESARFVERNKEGGFVARPVFDRPLAFLAYAVRDPRLRRVAHRGHAGARRREEAQPRLGAVVGVPRPRRPA